METKLRKAMRRNRQQSLETSLVEWKPQRPGAPRAPSASLGNFLSGMETGFTSFRYDALKPALETSLVEWKLFSSDMMKTDSGTLETSLVEWKLEPPESANPPLLCLGNFLSGMETRALRRRDIPPLLLGNFLSGMETVWGMGEQDHRAPLETSLVEWKQDTGQNQSTRSIFLGNFLSGMETSFSILPEL